MEKDSFTRHPKHWEKLMKILLKDSGEEKIDDKVSFEELL